MKYPALLLICLMTATTAAADCRFSKSIDKTFPAAGLEALDLKVLAGYLNVTGKSDDGVIEFHGHVCVDREIYLDRISLDTETVGNRLALTVIIPYDQPDFQAEYAFMNVVVSLPADLPVSIQDSSGDIEAYKASVSRIDDSSGNIRVTDGRSSLRIDDSSGDIRIVGNDGDVQVQDSSGGIGIRNVSGSVHIPRDSSGDIDVDTVSGSVRIDRDGSGAIDIRGVKGPVRIGSDGSGSIDVHAVDSDVNIDSDGSGNILATDISGNFTVGADGDGRIRTRQIRGKISLPR